MALAFEWVARIFAVSLLMILPGVAGQWLDTRFGTGFFALAGFALGIVAGMGTLLVMVSGQNEKSGIDIPTSSDKHSDQDSSKRER